MSSNSEVGNDDTSGWQSVVEITNSSTFISKRLNSQQIYIGVSVSLILLWHDFEVAMTGIKYKTWSTVAPNQFYFGLSLTRNHKVRLSYAVKIPQTIKKSRHNIFICTDFLFYNFVEDQLF